MKKRILCLTLGLMLTISQAVPAGAASRKAMDRGIKINEIIKEAAAIMGGGGGGRPNLAQGAGRDVNKISEALEFARSTVKDKLAQKNLNGFG